MSNKRQRQRLSFAKNTQEKLVGRSSLVDMRRWLLVFALALLLIAPRAQADDDPWQQFVDDDTTLLRSLPEADAAVATGTTDCAQACKALESLSRAAKHICDIAPEHCKEARARLSDATARVRAVCPSCAITEEQRAGGQASAIDVQETVQVSRTSGGCGGCATAPQSDAGAPYALALALLAWIRRRSAKEMNQG
jgi:uncharacterized protein (TIGR03382 family)